VSIQVLQDFYKSHMDIAVGPPRPLVTGESYQELEDRLTSGNGNCSLNELYAEAEV
jgi:hypothetical protein